MPADTLISEVIASKPQAIVVNSLDTVEEIGKLFEQKEIISAPVWDDELKKYIGFIDIIDVVAYACLVAHTTIDSKKELTSSYLKERYSIFSKDELEQFSFSFGIADEILKLPGSERRKMYQFQQNAKLLNVMTILSAHHRVLVEQATPSWWSIVDIFKSSNQKICSQTDIVQFIANHAKEPRFAAWKEQVDLTLRHFNFDTDFLTITPETRSLDGFLKMLDGETNAVGIVDQNGVLISTLTASDLRGIDSDGLRDLVLPVTEFLEKRIPYTIHPAITCRIDEKLMEAMNKMLSAKKHECWIVDASGKPIQMITMRKIVSLFAQLRHPEHSETTQ
jgi:predicted transcriptional regulator